MRSLFDDPEHWRGRAEEARMIAGTMKDGDSRRILLEIAVGYERMAEQADRLKGERR
jgi:hypothetical protein